MFFPFSLSATKDTCTQGKDVFHTRDKDSAISLRKETRIIYGVAQYIALHKIYWLT